MGPPTGGSGTAHRRQRYRPQAAVRPPTGGSGTAHRRQWDCPQAAVKPPTGGSEVTHRRQCGSHQLVVTPPTGGYYLQHKFVWLLLLDMFYELLPFFSCQIKFSWNTIWRTPLVFLSGGSYRRKIENFKVFICRHLTHALPSPMS